DGRVGRIRQKEGQPSGGQEDEDDRAGELPKQQLVGRQPALRLQEKVRVAQMTPSRLIPGESFGACVELLKSLSRWAAPKMPLAGRLPSHQNMFPPHCRIRT